MNNYVNETTNHAKNSLKHLLHTKIFLSNSRRGLEREYVYDIVKLLH